MKYASLIMAMVLVTSGMFGALSVVLPSAGAVYVSDPPVTVAGPTHYSFIYENDYFYLRRNIGERVEAIAASPFSATTGDWYTLKVELEGSSIKCYSDDVLVFDVRDSRFTSGSYGIASKMGAGFDDYSVSNSNGITIYTANFNAPNYDGWTVDKGAWLVASGVLEHNASAGNEGKIHVTFGTLTDGAIEVDCHHTVDTASWGITFRETKTQRLSVQTCAADNGRIYTVWDEDSGSDYDIFLSYSSNNGTSFTDPIRVNTNTSGHQMNPSVDVNSAGTVFVTWKDMSTDAGDIVLARSINGGNSFSPELRVNSYQPGTQAYPSLAVNGDDVAVVWEGDSGSDCNIRLWNADNGELMRELEGHTNAVLDMEFSPYGTFLASGGEDNLVKIWDTSTWAHTNLTDHSGQVTSVNWSSDGSMLATGSWDHNVTLWDTSDYSMITTLNTVNNGTADIPLLNPVNTVALSPDATPTSGQVAVAYNGRLGPTAPMGVPTEMYNITGWNLTTNSGWTANEDNGWHTSSVMDIAYSHDGDVIASCSKDRTVKIWDAATIAASGFEQRALLKDPYIFTNASLMVPTLLNNRTKYLYKISLVDESGTTTAYAFNITVNGLTKSASASSLPNNARDVIVQFNANEVNGSLDADITVEMLYKTNWTTADTWTGKMDIKEVKSVLMGHQALSLAWSPDDTEIAVGLRNGSIAVLNVSDMSVNYWLEQHTGQANAISWNTVRNEIVSGASDPRAKVWNLTSKTERLNLSGHNNSVYSVDWTPAGDRIATAGGNSIQYKMGEDQIYCAVSTDSGQTFSTQTMISDTCAKTRRRPRVDMDSGSNISVVWYDLRDVVENIYFANSTDKGVTFFTNIAVSKNIGKVENLPDIAVERDTGKVHVVWQYDEGTSIHYANSSDGFQNKIELAASGQMPRIATSPDGSSTWVTWRFKNSTTNFTYFQTDVTYDHGVTFNDLTDIFNGSFSVSAISIDSFGQASIVWLTAGSDWEVKHVSSEDDSYKPSVTGNIPPNGALNVSVFTNIQVNFSEPMNRQSVKDAFSISNGTVQDGNDCSVISWSRYSDKVTFRLRTPLDYLDFYTVTIASSAKDLSGNSLVADHSFSFTTRDDIDPPDINANLTITVDSITFSIDINANETFTVNYDQAVEISAEIKDWLGTVTSTYLYYQGVADATFTQLVMMHVSGDSYTAIIPAQNALGNVSYYLEASDNRGNTATLPSETGQHSNYSVVDETLPEITHIPITEWSVFKPIELWAVVTDEIDLASVELLYKSANLSTSTYTTLTMQPMTTANAFNCTIPAQNDVGTVQYWIETTDGSGNLNITQNYSVAIIDETAPQINWVKAEYFANTSKNVTVRTNVTDNLAVQDVFLFFKAVGGNSWVKRPMYPVGNHVYEFTIKAQQKSGTIYYYVNATDTSGNLASTLSEEDQYAIAVAGVGTNWTLYIILSAVLAALVLVFVYLLVRKFGKKGDPGLEDEPLESFEEEDEMPEPAPPAPAEGSEPASSTEGTGPDEHPGDVDKPTADPEPAEMPEPESPEPGDLESRSSEPDNPESDNPDRVDA